MKRKDLVYQFVKKHTEKLTSEEIEFGSGLTTSEISDALNIVRTNVSKELNLLVREGKIAKLEGRPVRYIDSSCLKWKPLSKVVKSYKDESLIKKKDRKSTRLNSSHWE